MELPNAFFLVELKWLQILSDICVIWIKARIVVSYQSEF